MDGLTLHETPPQKLPSMIAAFAGWPDAAEAATGAVRHLIRELAAKRFAEIDPDQFYDFTVVRPQTRVNKGGERTIEWPANDFYYHAPDDESRGLVLYVGTEPNLRWKPFSDTVLSVAEQCGVQFVVTLGALLDAVPHTREPRVTGRASSPELAQKVEWLGVRESGYQGPAGISTALAEACDKKGLANASLWGHSPHYAATSPNPGLSYALLTKLRGLVDFAVDLEELRLAGEAYETEVTQAISEQDDMIAYVQRLEQRYDAAHAATSDFPSSEAMVEELEEFLRSQHRPSDEENDSQDDFPSMG